MSAHPAAHGHDAHGSHAPADPIKDFYDRNKKLNSWIATHEIAHSDVYTTAAKELLHENGRLDLGKLKNADVQKKFADRMVALYLAHAEKVHGIKVPENDPDGFTKDTLLHMMSGQTRHDLERAVKELGEDYSLGQHREFTKGHIKQLAEVHGKYVSSAIQPQHKNQLLKFLNLEDKADEYDFNTVKQQFQQYLSTDVGAQRLKKMYDKPAHSHDAHHH